MKKCGIGIEVDGNVIDLIDATPENIKTFIDTRTVEQLRDFLASTLGFLKGFFSKIPDKRE